VAETILTASTVLTIDPRRPRAEAIALRGDAIAAVGSVEEVRRELGAEAQEVDLGGRALLPGFIDAHHHYCMAAFDRGTPDLHLRPGSSIEDLLACMREAAQERPEGGWVRAQGYDPRKLRERRTPTAAELDSACPDRPALAIAFSFHDGCLNSAGLEEMGWTRSSPDPPNGRLLRDRRGELTGEVSEQAFFLAEAHSRGSLLETGEEAWAAECERHGHELLRSGIVRVGDAAVPPAFEPLYERAAAEGRLPVSVHRMPVSADSLIEPRFDGDGTGSGPAGTPVGPAKLFMDGAERCAVCFSVREALLAFGVQLRKAAGGEGLAALRAAARVGRTRRGPDGLLHRGMLFWQQDALDEAVRRGAERGFQIAQHAICNEGIARALTALEHAGGALAGLPGAPRLEHLILVGREQPARLAAVGAIAVCQPYFIYDTGDQLRLAPLPPSLRTHPLRDLLDAGVELAGSSDYPVASYDVLKAVRGAATRRTMAGEALEPDQAIGVEEALRAYTAGSARALGVERETGTIAPGRRADLVALSADPLAVDPERLGELRVDRTWVGGELRFARTDE
jgi:predicted amidohydrolase YtcJ